MELRIFLIITVFTVALTLSSCGETSRDFNVEISYDEFCEINHHSGELEVEVSDTIIVGLCSNPATGSKWDYETTIKRILRKEDHYFEEPETNFSGTDGMEVWTFKAIKKGTTELRMEYSQPWEGGEWKAEWTYTLEVTVR